MHCADLQPLLPAAQIARRVCELGVAIGADHRDGSPLWLIGALKGAAFFLADLARAVERDVKIDFIQAASYGDGTESSGNVRIVRDLDHDVSGCSVVLVEDIVDSGRTANVLLRLLRGQNPASLRLAALLDKPSRRVEPVTIDYSGFEVDNRFVVGYGLDAAESYRNLPGIWTIEAPPTES